MNLRSTVAVRAYGTSEGVKKEWDTRGRGRKQDTKYLTNPPTSAFVTGKPINLIGYHNSNEAGELKMGRRGIFFAEAPSPDYGDVTHRAEIRMKNPFVAEEQVAAAIKLWPGVQQGKDGPPDVQKLLGDNPDPNNIGTQEWWGTMDRAITTEVKSRGHDGLIYTAPEALSLREYVVFDKANFNIGFVGKSADWVHKFPAEAKASSWATVIKKGNDANSMELLGTIGKFDLAEALRVKHKHKALAIMVKHMKIVAGGTSEGAKKAWDTRGRGKKAAAKSTTKSTKPPTPKQAEQAKTLYDALGAAIVMAHHKMEKIEHTKSITGKMLHLLKSVGGWLEAGSALAGIHAVVHGALHSAIAHGPTVMNTLGWAHQHLAPVMQHIAALAGMSSAADVDAFGMSRGRGSYRPKHIHLKGPGVHKPNPSGHAGFNVRKPNLSLHHLESYGTSEGVKKEWDERGRGKHQHGDLLKAAKVFLGWYGDHEASSHTDVSVQRLRGALQGAVGCKGCDSKLIALVKGVVEWASDTEMQNHTDVPMVKLREFVLNKSIKADMDGEPMTGNLGHVHMEPNLWFHPPSLTKRNSKESLRIPTDDPREDNDKFGDVSQRNDPKTKEFRMKLLKRSAPGGLPALIPARTTLLSPHSAGYMPTGMYGAARAARSRRLGWSDKRGMFTSFKNRGRI